MKISEQRIKAMVIMNVIDNCTMELDNTGQERYSLDENQFGKVVDTLVKNIKVIQCCEGEAAQLFCYTCEKWTEHNLKSEDDCKCLKCDTNKAK